MKRPALLRPLRTRWRLALLLCALSFGLSHAADPTRVESRLLSVTRIDASGQIHAADGACFTPVVAPDRWHLEGCTPSRAVNLSDLLPHSLAATGSTTIATAWLAEPTTRYAHGVLGDALEAAALRLTTKDGAPHVLRLPDSAVFEDLTPRLADLDGDGEDDILVVRSTTNGGAAAIVYTLRDGALAELAATPPIGRPNRWLNPIGVVDLDGNGRREVIYVETPHIGGILRIWEWQGDRLVPRAHAAGVSNHIIGSTELALHALVDFDGDGLVDVVVPDQTRTALKVFAMAGGTLAEITRVPLPGAVITRLHIARGAVLLGTENGRLLLIRPPAR